MASKENLETGASNNQNDNFGFNDQDFSFDFGPEQSDKRKAAAPLRSGVKDALKNHLTSPGIAREYVGKMLPKQYGTLMDDYDDAKNQVSDALDDVRRQTQGPINSLARNLQERVPKRFKRLHKIIQKTKDATATESYDWGINQQKMLNDAISGQMRDVFGEFEDNRRQENEEQEAIAADRYARDFANSKAQIDLSARAARALDHQMRFTRGVQLPYMKKSLELQFRTAAGIADLVNIQRALAEQQKIQLDGIIRNTGLPDIQKLRMSENYKQNIRNKFIDKTLGAFGNSGSPLGGMMKNLTDAVSDAASMIAMGVDGANMAMEMSGDDDFGEPEDPRYKRAKRLTGLATRVMPSLAGGVSKKFARRMPRLTKAVNRGARKIDNLRNNLHSNLQDYANGSSFDTNDAWIRDLVGVMLPDRDRDSSVSMSRKEGLKDVAHWDNLSRRSLNEVIPGYLARILQELQITRTGKKTGLLSFDYSKGKFENVSDAVSRLNAKANAKDTATRSSMQAVMADIERSGVKLSPDQKIALTRALNTGRKTGRTMTAKQLSKESFYSKQSPEHAAALAEAMRTHLRTDSRGRFTDKRLGERASNNLFRNLASGDLDQNNIRAYIQELFDQGQGEVAYQAGWMREDGSIDMDRVYDSMAGIDPGQKGTGGYVDSPEGGRRAPRAPRQGRARAEAGVPPVPLAAESKVQLQERSDAVSNSIAIVSAIEAFQESADARLSAILEELKKQERAIDKAMGDTGPGFSMPSMQGAATGIRAKLAGMFSGMRGGGNSAEAMGGAPMGGDEFQGPVMPGFWKRNIREHAVSAFNSGRRMIRRAGRGLTRADSFARNTLFGRDASYKEGFGEMAENSRIVGARKFKDFKDGLPELGDIYLPNAREAVITGAMLAAGNVRDSAGNIITNLADLAKAKGDILDEAGNVLLSKKDLVKSFVKANGEIIRDVWADRVKRAAALTRDVVSKLVSGATDTSRLIDKGLRAGLKGARMAIAPPRDVYVSGEEEPRLYAYLMKAGLYFDKLTGDPINFPTQIKGPVLDEDGNEVITKEDLVKGLVDKEGKPFKTIMRRVMDKMKTNMARSVEIGKSVMRGVGRGLKTAGRLGSTFMTRGLTGVMSGTWKSSYDPASNGAGGASGDATVMLLTEIRDIMLATMYPRKNGMPSIFGSGGNSNDEERRKNINDYTPRDVVESEGSARPNSIDSAASLVTGAVGGLVSAGKGLFNRFSRRGRLKAARQRRADRQAGSGEGGESLLPETKPDTTQSEAKQKRGLFSRLKSIARNKKDGKPKVDTSGMRVGSAEERKANWVNINEPTKTLDDVVMPEKSERQNTFDMLASAIGKGLSGLGSILGDTLGNFADLLGGGGRRGKKGLARRAMGKAASLLGKGARFAGRGAATIGRGIFGGVGGTAGRVATTGRVLQGLGTAGGFLAKRIAVPALAGIASVLGAPVVGGAIAVGGAVWGLKSLYDLFSDKKKDPTKKTLEAVRMTEYGFSPDDSSACARILKLEDMLNVAVKTEGTQLELDKNAIEVEPILIMFSIPKDDVTGLKRFIEWFNGRFKPTYLKWKSVSQVLSKKDMSSLDDLDSEQSLKVLEATAEDTGWDVMANPLGPKPLAVDASDVSKMRKAAISLYEGKKDKAKKDGVPESLTKKEAFARMDQAMADSINGKPWALQNEWNKIDIGEAVKKGENGKKMASYTSQAMMRTPTGPLTALQSIRIRLYGYGDPTMGNVMAMRAMEQAFLDDIIVDSNGVGVYNGDLAVVYSNVAKYFGLSPSDAQSELRWTAWVKARFLPVYVTFVGQMQHKTGGKMEFDLERKLDNLGIYEIAQAIVGVDVWKETVMPVVGQVADKDPNTIKPFMDGLRDAAEKQKAREIVPKPAPTTEQSKRDMSATPAQMGGTTSRTEPMGTPVSFNPRAQNPATFNTMPDAETEPKSSGGSASTGVDRTPSAPSNLPAAGGELASGGSGMQWVKSPGGNHIEGLNPEVKRLFLGMAQEYGEMTQQKIQVNRGFVSFDEQKREYEKNPKKAAPPGSSNHEFGLALDINSVDLNRLEKLGLLRKYGFTRPVGGETWHMEPAGIQHDFKALRKDPAAAAQAVKDGVGQGGGGVGATKTGFRFGGRDTKHAMQARRAADAAIAEASGSSQREVGGAPVVAGSPRSINVSQGAPSSGGSSSGAAADAGGSTGSASSGGSSPTPAPSGDSGSLYASMPAGEGKEGMKSMLAHAAKAVGVDPRDAIMTAAMESSFNPTANSGQAKGLMQFTDGTWGDVMKKHGSSYGIPSGTSPTDPKAAAILGARYLKDNMEKDNNGASPIEAGYMRYFLGPTGGSRALKMGNDEDMAKAFPSFAAKNKDVFYNSDGSPRTKGQFMEYVRGRMRKTAKDFGIDLPKLSGDGSPSAVQTVTGNKSSGASAKQVVFDDSKRSASGGGSTVRTSSPASSGGSYFESTPAMQAARTPQSAPQVPESQRMLAQSLEISNKVAVESRDTLVLILQATQQLVAMSENRAKETQASTPPSQSEVPRSERPMRSVSPPAYRTT